jgi:acyl-coenzyme A thioesterase PaaI-like protein
LLNALTDNRPYWQFMGFQFHHAGDDITAVMPFVDRLIGDPTGPALHGGATASLLEVAGFVTLGFAYLCHQAENGVIDAKALMAGALPDLLPKTINITVDYLRPGQLCDTFARAQIIRSGRRYANVQITAWQDAKTRPIAQAMAHFAMPDPKE